MHFQYLPYLWVLAISVIILLFLAFITFRHRKVLGSKAFGLCLLNFTFWTVCNGLEMAGTDLETKLFWANMQYLSYTTIHVCWLYMVLQFTGYKKWTKLNRILPLFIIPIIIILLVWTDQYHGLIRNNISLDYTGSFPVIKKTYGPIYWIHPIYGYSITLISIVIISKAVFIHRSIYRMQAVALLVSPVISFIPSIMYVLSLSPIKGFDITPVFFGISGIIAAIGLFRYQLFAIVPVARDVAVDNINIGMIVIDNRGVVVDVNVAAAKYLGEETKTIIGMSADKAVALLYINWNDLQKINILNHEVFFKESEEKWYYEVQLLPLHRKYGKQVGKVLLIRNVTDNIKAQIQILEQSSQLAVSKEKEKYARDLHDNLGQVLAFINIQAQGIQKELIETNSIETVSKNISKLVDVSQLAHKDIREYIKNTRTNIQVQNDFLSVIKKDIQQFKEQTGKRIELEIVDESVWKNLQSNQRINILYIIKEALNNIRKHSPGATKIKLSLTIRKEQLCVTITDNGNGFNVNSINKKELNQYGLLIMHERAIEIDGDIKIDSALGEGTCIEIDIPINYVNYGGVPNG